MVTISDVGNLGFDDIFDYFEYIVDSRVNGNHKQAKELFNNLSDGMQGQKVEFFNWLETTFHYDEEGEDENITHEWRIYLSNIKQ